MRVQALELKSHGVSVCTYKKNKHCREGNKSHFQEAINFKSVYECELMRFTIHVGYIQIMLRKEKIHDKEYLKYIPYHPLWYIEIEVPKNCKHIFVVSIHCWDLAFISK